MRRDSPLIPEQKFLPQTPVGVVLPVSGSLVGNAATEWNFVFKEKKRC